MDASDLFYTPVALTSIAPWVGVDVVAKNIIPGPAGNRTLVVQPVAIHRSVQHA
jgi:hypothetical protein